MADTLKILWLGADGSEWDLLSPFSPVFLTSLDGLGLPHFSQQWAESGARDGKRYEGTTWDTNDVTLSVVVGDDYVPAGFMHRRHGDEWRALDAAWRRSLSPEVPGKLVVISGAGRRELGLRLNNRIAPPAGVNPGLRGVATYDVDLTAGDQPWWAGPEVSKTFGWDAGSQPFFGGVDGTVLLYISPSAETDEASITNPGHRPTPPRWWARGPFTSVTVGVGDEVATLPFALGPGQIVYVDSVDETIVNGAGVSQWPRMGYSDPIFADIPPGEPVPLTVRIGEGGPGSAVGVSITPLYEGPW